MQSWHKISVISAALWLAACAAVGPDYTAPTFEPKLTLSSSEINLTEREVSWWQGFGDAQLNRLVEQALQNNPSVDIAKANAAAAYALFSNTDNDSLPKGSLGLDYSAQDQIVLGTTDHQRVASRSYRGGASLGWDVDLFGKLQRASQAALADAESRYYAWQDVQVSIVAQVATSYARLTGLEARIAVARLTISSLERTQGVIHSREEAGYASQLDVLRIEAQLKGVAASIPALQGELLTTQHSLAALIGLAPNELQLDLHRGIPELAHPVAIGDPNQLLRRRADLKAAERTLAAASAQIGVQTARLYPDISVSGFVGFLSANSLNFGVQTKAWSIAPSISWPAFDLGSVQAQIDIASANERAAYGQFRRALLGVLAEAQSSVDQYAQTQLQAHLLTAQVAASQHSLELAQLQYDAGSIDLLALLDVERTLLSAKDNLAQAKAQVFANIIEVYRSFGGGLTDQNLLAVRVTLAE